MEFPDEFTRLLKQGELWEPEDVESFRWQRNQEGIVERLTGIAKGIKDRLRTNRDLEKTRRLAQEHLEKGDVEKAIQYATHLLDMKHRYAGYQDQEQHYKWKYERNFTPVPEKQAIAKTIDMIHRGDFWEAHYELYKMQGNRSKTGESAVDIIFLTAALLEAIGENPYDMYERAISEKIHEQGLSLEIYNESRNKVHIVRMEQFPEGLFFVKEYADEDTLETELRNSIVFRKYVGECIQRYMAAYSDEDSFTGLFRSAGTLTLDEMIADGSRRRTVKAVRQAAKILAHIHVFGTKIHKKGLPPSADAFTPTITDPVAQSDDFFTQKIRSTLLRYSISTEETGVTSPTTDRFINAYSEFIRPLASAERDFYKDHNPRNIIVGEGGITAIDFETALILPCLIDLVSLLEFGATYLTDKQKAKAVEDYLTAKERLLQRDIKRVALMKHHGYAKVQRHLELTGYRARDARMAADDVVREAESARRHYHVMTALHQLQTMKESEPRNRRITIAAVYEELKAMHERELDLD
jgi:thiamine kinase-like enzyme